MRTGFLGDLVVDRTIHTSERWARLRCFLQEHHRPIRRPPMGVVPSSNQDYGLGMVDVTPWGLRVLVYYICPRNTYLTLLLL